MTEPTLDERQKLLRRLRLNAADRDAALEMAVIYRREKNPAAAVKMLTDAAKELPGDLTLLWELEEARLLRSLQQLGEVRMIAKKIGPEQVAEDLQRVVANWANTRLQVCTARVARDPALVHLRLMIGEAHLELEDYQDAIDSVQPLIDDPRHAATASFITARAHQAMGHDAAAMSAYRGAALCRSHPVTPALAIAAIRPLITMATRHGLDASKKIYQQRLDELQGLLMDSHAPESV